MRTTPFLLALAALGLAPAGRAAARGCDSVRGDGNQVTQERQLPPFTRIELRAHVDVEVTEGPAQSVSVTIDQNLQPFLTTAVEGGRLVIDASRSIGGRGPGKVVVSLPELRAFALQGSGNVRIAGADKDRDVALSVEGSGDLDWSGKARTLAARILGSGDLRVSGAAERLEAAIEGSGDIAARDLAARSAKLGIAGSGDIAAAVEGGPMSATVDGSGDIQWWGRAQVEVAAVNGSGSIRHR
jgi:hypothetical protein